MLLNSCQEDEHNMSAGLHLIVSKLSSCPTFPMDIITLQTPTFTPNARPIYQAMNPHPLDNIPLLISTDTAEQ